tara:strand:- start:73 stop:681 length:609 start_codon:yes stop_codon:yes gene_type:complete
MNPLTKKQSKTATFLWKECGYSRTEIAAILKIPNDRNLSFGIEGQMRNLAKSHENLDSRLVEHHETYPCPICFPRKSLDRKQEDIEWESFKHSQSCLMKHYGMWEHRTRKTVFTNTKSNDIVVVEESTETIPIDTSKVNKREENEMTKPTEKPLSKVETNELLRQVKLGDDNPKVIAQLKTRFKGTKKQIDRKIRKALKRLK